MFKSFFSALIATVLFTGVASAGEIVINGSTTVLPIVQKVSEPFMGANPSVNISIAGGGSGNGIKALIDNLTDIAMASRPIKESEIEKAKVNGVNPVAYAVGLDALIPVIHPSNTVADLSLTQLQDIYTGKIKNWKELGGADAKIVVISRDTSSGTYETWAEFVMKGERVMPAALLQASNGAVVQAVSKNKNAIGYIGFGYLDSSLKATKVNGLVASPETALNKSWPISRELWLYTKNEPTGDMKAFMDYILSPEGQAFVKEVGFIPVK